MDIKKLVPALLEDEDGNYLAPMSSTSTVFTDDNETVDQVLKNVKNTSNTILYTEVQILEATFDQQSIFNLKYPIENYDLSKFPIIILSRLKTGEAVTRLPSDYYQINQNYPNDDQLLINTTKVEPFKKGETAIAIYHYSDTIYNGSVINADTINNTYINIGAPGNGEELPDPSVYFDFEGSQIIYHNDGVTTYFPIGSSQILRTSTTITSTTQEISVDIEGYNPAEDSLVIYENNTYIGEGTYYTVDKNLKMHKLNNVVWNATSYDPITFDFMVYKRSKGLKIGTDSSYTGNSNINDGTISMAKLTLDLQNTIKDLQKEVEDLKAQINN